MVEQLRSWLRRFTSRDTPTPTVQSRGSEQAARENRATLVESLREDVSRLQQETLTLSNAEGGQPRGAERPPENVKIAALERQLNEKQQELAKFQGRI
jgi:hypothetical protein